VAEISSSSATAIAGMRFSGSPSASFEMPTLRNKIAPSSPTEAATSS
jgi:hypothetical protein